ncbi:Holliday junction branch migration protein RuvA [Desertivibrio insolitus]|uniref:Holliday junction branch migration protein RuvA n=1 Tax=Herbiconiux sp. SYSU D00978 TaxID=2812562 RepID=UPI001A971331|nr:Holliday junction branch migration protein RuvA [Herbiconiux sp. SYSU D00978]
MIASVRGTVLHAAGSSVVLEVGGVGLAVTVTPPVALSLRVGAEARLHTALVVREDDLSLFGFLEAEELGVFDLLRSVGGVGPKSAMGVLAVMTPADVAQAVADENDAAFRRVSGIGPKTAKLIVVSLTGKIHATAATGSSPAAAAGGADDVLTALVGLGWSEKVARDALEKVRKEQGTDVSSALQLRAALAQLGPQPAAGR